MNKRTIVNELVDLLGSDCVSVESDLITKHSRDTWPLRLVQQKFSDESAKPICVIRPQNKEEISKALAYLNEKGVNVVPYGGGSGVTGGAEPTSHSVVISLEKMDEILHFDKNNFTVTVQPGINMGKLEKWLNERHFISGHYPQSIDLAQLGGLISTRSSGQFSTKYGNIEDLLVGLEAVLPNGELIRIKNIPRRSSGPDLRHIWLGSEGTFGIITEVTMKIFPQPEERWMQAYALQSMRQGLKCIQQFMQKGWKPAVVRLHDAFEASQKYSKHLNKNEPILLLLSEGPEGYAQLEGNALDKIVQENGGRPLGSKPVETWLEHRNEASALWTLTSKGMIVDTIEISAMWTDIATIYEQVTSQLREEIPELLAVSGHASHAYMQGTNIYFVLATKPLHNLTEIDRVYWSIWNIVMEITLANNGSICHHHGIGKLRAQWMPEELGTSYQILKSMKRAFDPNNIMNQGTLLPDSKVITKQ